jgi:membrane-bound lytic murein transglycosylase D
LSGVLALLVLAGCATPNAPAAPRSEATAAVPTPEYAAPAQSDPPQVPAEAAPLDANAEPSLAAPVPLDPLRPDVRLDLNDRDAQADLWERVRRGFAMPDIDNGLVRDREQWYASRPDYVQRMTERGSRYLFHIVEELERRGMPTELALLPFIESAFNPEAMSSAKASGMWQFMPSTGRHFSLKQNVFRDDRRDVLASTRAALDYLKKLYGMFGDWHLALAAYNWGEGNVARGIARNRQLGQPTDYASLKMPNETRLYVPKLQAVKNIIARPVDFGLTLPTLANHPYFLSVTIARDVDVDLAASLAGMGVEEFRTLNPQMNKPVILAAVTPQVLLPYDNANQFVRQLPLHRGPLATWTAWVAPKTLRPSDAAHQVGMSEAHLREVNQIPPQMLVKAGSTLLVSRGEQRQADVSGRVADNATMALAPDGPMLRKTSLRAGRNDSVASVAKRYRISAAQVATWNQVGATAYFVPGQAIVVYVPAAKPAALATRAVAAARKSSPIKHPQRTTAKAPVRVAKN